MKLTVYRWTMTRGRRMRWHMRLLWRGSPLSWWWPILVMGLPVLVIGCTMLVIGCTVLAIWWTVLIMLWNVLILMPPWVIILRRHPKGRLILARWGTRRRRVCPTRVVPARHRRLSICINIEPGNSLGSESHLSRRLKVNVPSLVAVEEGEINVLLG